jgi:hypothetical protein
MCVARHLAPLLGLGVGLGACGTLQRRAATLPPCDEASAAAMDTTTWRRLAGGPYPTLLLPPEFAYDAGLTIVCYHDGLLWSDTTAAAADRHRRFVGWCREDGTPPIDAPDSVVRRLPAPPPSRSGDAVLCALSFPVLGQRMALRRSRGPGAPAVWEWTTWPLEHGEPFYLFVRGPSVRDETVAIQALRSMRWMR